MNRNVATLLVIDSISTQRLYTEALLNHGLKRIVYSLKTVGHR